MIKHRYVRNSISENCERRHCTVQTSVHIFLVGSLAAHPSTARLNRHHLTMSISSSAFLSLLFSIAFASLFCWVQHGPYGRVGNK